MNDYYDLPVIHLLRKAPHGFARSPYAVEANPWARRGKVEAALLFRGVIVSSFGFIETRLAELSIQISRLECYSNLATAFPYSIPKRLNFLRKAFSYGPLLPYQETAEHFLERFEQSSELRNLIAHSRMQILPDWGVTLEDFDVKKGKIDHRTRRFTIEEFERMAHKAARFGRLSQQLSDKLSALSILPPIAS